MKDQFIQLLISNNLVKFGEVKLKSGLSSNIYVDLRELTEYLELFQFAVSQVKRKVDVIKEKRSRESGRIAIVGVPYGVVPIAAAVAYESDLPYHPVRKETKDYGKKPSLAKEDTKYIVIEDVMSTGSSIVETIEKLNGDTVTDVIVIVDREHGGAEKLRSSYPNIQIHSILKLSELMAKLPSDI